MSTPQQPPSKGPRRSPRRPKQSQQSEAAEPIFALSEPDTMAQINKSRSTGQNTPQKEGQKKRRPQSSKRQQENTVSEGGHPPHGGAPHEKEKMKPTPLKPAYAGPTFHASPAPSALPLPSFYSKSVPNVSTIKMPEIANDSRALTTEPAKADGILEPEREKNKRESTPLDWMFEAARQSKGTPRAESPSATSINLSTSRNSPYRGSPVPREGETVFPFELEGNDTDHGEIGDAFATPYKERLEKLRLATSTGTTPTLDERERQAKSEALKKLLMNSQLLRSASASPGVPDTENPFNARAPQARNLNTPAQHYRHRSGPSTPVSFYGQQPNPSHHFPPLPPGGNNIQNYHQNHNSPMYRPMSSQLRHVYQPSAESSPVELSSEWTPTQQLVSTARQQANRSQIPRQEQARSQPGHNHTLGQEYEPRVEEPASHQVSQPRPKPSSQQLEDELRRFLKI